MGTSKGKKDDHLPDPAGDLFDPSGPPRPNLRADIVDNGDVLLISIAGEPEVEIGEVDQDDQVGPLLADRLFEHPEGLQDRPDLGKDLRDSYDREGPGGIEEFHPRGLKPFSSHPKKSDLGIDPMDGADEMAALEVSGDFSGHHENLLSFHLITGFPTSSFQGVLRFAG